MAKDLSVGFSSRALAPVLLLAALGVGCSSSKEGESEGEPERVLPEPAKVVEEISARSTVVSVDPQTRDIALRAADGRTWTIRAGPEVRNFDQIGVGDTVVVRYQQALAVALARPGQAPVPAAATVATGRAEVGAKPAGGIAGAITATVRIESIDTEKNIVVFTDAHGEVQAIKVQREEGRQFIRGLRSGDMVEITYVEALALSVEES